MTKTYETGADGVLALKEIQTILLKHCSPETTFMAVDLAYLEVAQAQHQADVEKVKGIRGEGLLEGGIISDWSLCQLAVLEALGEKEV